MVCVEAGNVRVTDLTITTYDEKMLVDNVSFVIPDGSHIALIGRSGSGKSLIAAALTSRLPQTLKFHGLIEAPERCLLIHQDSAETFNPLVRMGQQLAIAEKDEEHVIEILENLGFENPKQVLSRYPAELSGGQRQRLAIAIGLLAGAELIVADECTTALDPVNQRSVVEALSQVHSASVVFITHDIALASECCSYLHVVNEGKIVESGVFVEVIAHPRHESTQALIQHAFERHEVMF